jgi:hypothetical protein
MSAVMNHEMITPGRRLGHSRYRIEREVGTFECLLVVKVVISVLVLEVQVKG